VKGASPGRCQHVFGGATPCRPVVAAYKTAQTEQSRSDVPSRGSEDKMAPSGPLRPATARNLAPARFRVLCGEMPANVVEYMVE